MTAWKSYEEVAQYLLNEFAAAFELGRVEGKQIVPGAAHEGIRHVLLSPESTTTDYNTL